MAAVREEVGRPIGIVAVTKSLDASAWFAAAEAGCDAIGENYVQELRDKHAQCSPGAVQLPPLHAIGRIQTNKVRLVADIVSLWQSVDRSSVIEELAKRAPSARLLIQVNTTGEDTKSGCDPTEVGALVDAAAARGLSCDGLMTIGPTDGAVGPTTDAFRLLRRLVDEHGLTECSMGMSGDYRIAADEGSTMLRLGTVLFGRRSPRPRDGGR